MNTTPAAAGGAPTFSRLLRVGVAMALTGILIAFGSTGSARASTPTGLPVSGTNTNPWLSSTSGAGPLQSVEWADVTLPGSACESQGPIQLQNGSASIPHTRLGNVDSFGADPGLVMANFYGGVAYGNLSGVGPAAAVPVWCSNNSGMADGQLRVVYVLFTGAAAHPRAIGVISSRQPAGEHADHAAILWRGAFLNGRFRVAEAWYGPSDFTSTPTGRAWTTWTYSHGHLTSSTDVLRQPNGVQG